MGRKTSRSEKKGFASGASPRKGETLIAHSYSPSDAFSQNVVQQRLLKNGDTITGTGRMADGSSLMNDDFYRHGSVSIVKDSSKSSGRRFQLSLARQLATKENKEAVIRLVARSNQFHSDASKKEKAVSPMVNVIPPYTKFFLESVSESKSEKAQIIETFGSFMAFFFGKHPEVYQFSGRLLNAKNHDWKNDFQEIYDNFIRGTKAVENNAIVYLQYDDVLVEGFVVGTRMDYHGASNNECPFSFSVLVTRRAPVNQIQRLQDRRARSRFSAAEQQILNDLSKLRKSDPTTFVLMQTALSSKGLDTSDISLLKDKNKKLKSSNVGKNCTPTSKENEDLSGPDSFTNRFHDF